MSKVIPIVSPIATIGGMRLNEHELHAISIALRRQFVELSAKIENVQSIVENITTKVMKLNERRALFTLIERFDGVIPENDTADVGAWECRLDINAHRLNSDDVKRVLDALIWMRDNWLQDHEAIRQVTINVIGRIENDK